MQKNLPTSLTSLTEQVQRIPLHMVREGVVTLRSHYDEDGLEELGASLIAHKQLQTIVVQPGNDDHYDLVIGSRRVRAARLKELQDIAAYVIEPRTPIELLFIALAENLHRVDLDPFEEAQAFLRLIKEYGLDPKGVASGINRSDHYVRNRLQLLSMPEEVATLVSEKRLNISFISILARLPDGETQVTFAHRAVQHHLTEAELRAMVAKELEEPQRTGRQPFELTSVKVQARVSEFVAFLQKIPRRMKMRRLNADDKSDMLRSLQKLANEVKLLQETVQGVQTTSTPSSANSNLGNGTSRRNHGQEWTTEEIRRINSPRRPSDEELSGQLGRTIGAIQQMRAKT